MEINPNDRTYFIVKLISGSLKRLMIPDGFAKQWKGKSSRICKFKCVNNQKLLRVYIVKSKGSYFFSHGWRKFVKIHKLEEGNFLVFYLIPPRTFEVVIYKEEDSCPASTEPLSGVSNGGVTEDADYSVKRRTNARRSGNVRNVKHETEIEVEAGEVETLEDPYFTVTLKSYHSHVMILPKAFARETGIMEMENVVVIDEQGRRWYIVVVMRPKQSGGRVELTRGWSSCLKANNLVPGDVCLFKFLNSNDNVLHLQKIQK